MKIVSYTVRNRAFTLVELLVVIAVAMILFAGIFSGAEFTHAKARAQRIQCVNNLRQIGLAARVWQGSQLVVFPMSVPGTNGGTKEFVTGPNAWRHFQVMSNELSTPKILLCPADASRAMAATNFNFFSNSNLSYFIGLDAWDAEPESVLSGDRNVTNGMPIKNGVLEWSADHPAGWSDEIHRKVGNVLLADGSVQQVTWTGLRHAFVNAHSPTNHMQMPVLTP